MVEFIQKLIGNDLWSTLIMSFVPLIELKGGIVFARGVGFGLIEAFLLGWLGSTLVFFPIYFLLRPILNLLKRIKWFSKFATKVENYFNDKATETLDNQKSKGKKLSANALKMLGVFVFVAIPLPMTGVWTGTAIAVFLNLKFKDAMPMAILGNIVAGLIISLLAELCITFWDIKSLDYILYALFALAIILLAVFIIKVARKKTDGKEGE